MLPYCAMDFLFASSAELVRIFLGCVGPSSLLPEQELQVTLALQLSLIHTSACFVTPSLSKLSLAGLHLPVRIATALCLLTVYPSTFIVPFFTDFTVDWLSVCTFYV